VVATVGASVEPYARFTTAPSSLRARSTKAGVTSAPPQDSSRSELVRCDAKEGSSISARKKVGGPTM
jgi:hypothetical protein